MAKDRRNKVRPTMDLGRDTPNNAQAKAARPASSDADKTVRTAPSASSRRSSAPAEVSAPSRPSDKAAPPSTRRKRKRPRHKKQKLSRAALILRCTLAVLIVSMTVFIVLVAGVVIDMLTADNTDKNPPINAEQFQKTPEGLRDDVSYYLVGLLAENETQNMPMLSVVCHNKKDGTASVLQIPSSTQIAHEYVDQDGETVEMWGVDSAGMIYNSPKEFLWCNNDNVDTCRRILYAEDIITNEETGVKTHKACGKAITTKKGSATESITFFVNEQLGLPVDAYFIFSPETLIDLIDSLGGINLNFSDGTEQDIRHVTGEEALAHINEQSRATRQRQLFAAVLDRIYARGTAKDFDAVNDEIIKPLMSSPNPIRSNLESKDITAILEGLSKVGLAKTTVYLMPSDYYSYYSEAGDAYFADKEQLLTLLNASFRPHMPKLKSADITLPEKPEIEGSTPVDTRKGTLSDVLVPQVDFFDEDDLAEDEDGTGEDTSSDTAA